MMKEEGTVIGFTSDMIADEIEVEAAEVEGISEVEAAEAVPVPEKRKK